MARPRKKNTANTDAPVSNSATEGIYTRTRAQNTSWSQAETESLLAQLQQAKDDGNMSENGFKQTVWKSIQDSFEDPAKKKTRAPSSKYDRLKQAFKEVRFFHERLSASGFGWNWELGLPTASNEVWEALAQVYLYSLLYKLL
jgi:hypothetical protein